MAFFVKVCPRVETLSRILGRGVTLHLLRQFLLRSHSRLIDNGDNKIPVTGPGTPTVAPTGIPTGIPI